MKNVSLSVLLAAAIFFLAGVLLLRSPGPGPGGTPAGPGAADVGGRDDMLSSEISRVSERIEALERAISRLPALEETATPSDASGSGATPAAPSSGVSSDAATAAADGAAAGRPTEAGELQAMIARIIREENAAREREREEQSRKRMQEWQALREGPWGQHNYRINTLAKKLGLDDSQKQYYHRTLTEFEPRFRDLRKSVQWANAESRAAYQKGADQLQQDFESAVRLGLGPEQRQAYDGLPAWERNLGGAAISVGAGGAGFAEVQTFAIDATGGTLDTFVELEADGASVEAADSAAGVAPSAGGAVRIIVGGAVERNGEGDPPPVPLPPAPVPPPEDPVAPR